MNRNKVLYVYYKEMHVGTLADAGHGKIAFEYGDEWMEKGFAISPFSLPLEKRVFICNKPHFGGLFGVFADSLPDAWGNILLNRMLKKNGLRAEEITVLDRLAIVGNSGMGALTYKPEMQLESAEGPLDLDMLACECRKILQSQYSEELDELYHLGGTSGGARPKIMTELDGTHWIIKFPAHVDGKDSGKMEYDYSVCARKCGIFMPETRLFQSKECAGYFGIERFDRVGSERIHMLTVAAILELNFEEPNLDYDSLLKLTKILTRDSESQMEQMYRRMCFNVFAHNRDDHSKNFSFLYDEKIQEWKLSPAYDMTYSTTYYGEHTTTVNGNGKNPLEKDLIIVGTKAGIEKGRCAQLLEEIRETVNHDLAEYING